MMDLIEQRVENMLRSPVGCEFLLSVEESGLAPEEVSTPLTSFWLAAESVNLLDLHSGDYEEIAAGALERGERLGPLARSILGHPSTEWWFGAVDPGSQVWIGHEGELPITSKWKRPGTPPDRWEKYAQKPRDLQFTSTEVEGLTSLFVAYDNGTGDLGIWPATLPCWSLQIAQDVKVFEVHGPNDWHELCVRYPAGGTDAQGSEDGRLTPDWGAVSADWDGVHLSMGGLLTSLEVRNESAEGWSMLTFWDSEITYWLRPLSAKAMRRPDHIRDIDRQPTNLILGDPTPGRTFGVPLTRIDDPGDLDELIERLREQLGRGS